MAGLVKNKDGQSLPLRSVAVEGDIKGYLLGLNIKLVYENNDKNPVEVTFKMPLENSQAVVGLTAIVDERKIRAQLKKKEEAMVAYDDAIASGQTAAMGSFSEREDIFCVSLGNLPEGRKADIRLDVVSQLPVDAEGKICFSLPALLKEYYTPAVLPGAGPATNTTLTTSDVHGTVSGIDLLVLKVHNSNAIKSIVSPTHAITVADSDTDIKVVTVSDIQSDVVIQVQMNEPHIPFAITEYGAHSEGKDGSFFANDVVMLNFFPEIPHIKVSSELIFLVDRSGSMSGSFIRSASETLVLFMKSIPEGCYFNIYGFGSTYEHLFSSSVPYNQKNLEIAMKHVQSLKANLGGTEILPPLKDIFSQPLVSNLPRQIFLLTDGAVGNTSDCIRVVKMNAVKARCFTFGIGSGASSTLVEGIARAGCGTAEFVKEGERLQPKVVRSLKHALQPSITDISITFELSRANDVVQVVPSSMQPVFDGDQFVAYGIIKSSDPSVVAPIEGQVTLRGKIGSNEILHTIQVKDVAHRETTDAEPFRFLVHSLAAKTLLAEMEQKQNVTTKADITKLSIETNVICKETTFIAVDEETNAPVQGALVTYGLEATSSMIANIASIQSLMLNNIDNAITRCDALDDLDVKCDGLQSQSKMFSSAQRRYKSGGFLSGISSTISSWFDRSSYTPRGIAPSRTRSNSFGKRREERCDTPSPEIEEELEIGHMQLLDSPMESPLPRENIGGNDFSSVIILQQANGTWTLSKSLASFLSVDVEVMKDAIPDICSDHPEIWATALVVTVLRMKFLSRQDEWELVVTKADDWLKRQLSVDELSRIYEAAKQFLA